MQCGRSNHAYLTAVPKLALKSDSCVILGLGGDKVVESRLGIRCACSVMRWLASAGRSTDA